MGLAKGIKMIKGSIVAMVTPFNEDLSVDYDGFCALVDWSINQGSNGIVVAGTTGESATLTSHEKFELLKLAIEVSQGRVPIIFNGGTNCTRASTEAAQQAHKAGADAVMAVVPYYNKPSSSGLKEHFKAIAGASDLPLILYNVPSRTALEISTEDVIELSLVNNIVGIKDASPDLERAINISRATKSDFVLLSGNDSLALGYMACGGSGCISVSANIIPGEFARVFSLWESGDIASAMALQEKYFDLHRVLFFENSPAPTKYALSLLGLCTPYVRLPLSSASAACKDTIEKHMKLAEVM